MTVQTFSWNYIIIFPRQTRSFISLRKHFNYLCTKLFLRDDCFNIYIKYTFTDSYNCWAAGNTCECRVMSSIVHHMWLRILITITSPLHFLPWNSFVWISSLMICSWHAHSTLRACAFAALGSVSFILKACIYSLRCSKGWPNYKGPGWGKSKCDIFFFVALKRVNNVNISKDSGYNIFHRIMNYIGRV